jgi:hypothetical protein
MNEQEKRVRLAQLLGWKNIWQRNTYDYAGVSPTGEEIDLPWWWSTLDDAHALGEEMMRRGLMEEYIAAIYDPYIAMPDRLPWEQYLLLCPASVRAEAALAVLERKEKK